MKPIMTTLGDDDIAPLLQEPPTRDAASQTGAREDDASPPPGSGLPSLQPLLVGAVIVWLLTAYVMQVAVVPSGAPVQ